MKKILAKIKFTLSRFTISKRQQFVGITLLMTIILMSTQIFSGGGLRLDVLMALAVISYILSVLVLRQDLKGWEFLTLLVLPVYFTVAVFLFYFLLPTRWLTRLPIAFLYALGMYAILLTENIYNVAAERSIQLLRAAHSVGFLLSLVTSFFLVDTLLSLHLSYYLIVLLGIIIFLPLTIQALWAMELTSNISIKVWIGSIIITFILGEALLIFSFWPIKITIEALFITTIFYSLVGMVQQYLIERLFAKTVKEYLTILILVFIIALVTTTWGQGIY